MRFSPEVKGRMHELGSVTIADMFASTGGGLFAMSTTRGREGLPGRPQLLPSAVMLDGELRDVSAMPGPAGTLVSGGATVGLPR